MASITIRNLDESLKQKLRERAAKNGRSMEQETRLILQEVLTKQKEDDQQSLIDVVNEIKTQYGSWGFDIPERSKEKPRGLSFNEGD
jgi:plasmid stability protein